MATKVLKNAIFPLVFIYIQGGLIPLELFLKDPRHQRDTKQCHVILYNHESLGIWTSPIFKRRH